MSSSFGRVAGVAILFLVVLALPASATTINTTFSGWGGVTYVQSFGRPNTATYGQTLPKLLLIYSSLQGNLRCNKYTVKKHSKQGEKI
jgi:hypothetical protein